ncbi:energy transducer TonB [Fluviicola sp.]|uniref:energy transducer TonB n=1 Tax=Fluviicola sp. TaxID=1917219 RepID=UPI003D2DDCB3
MNFNLTKSGLIFLLSFLGFQSFGQTEEPKTANSSSKSVDEDKIYEFVDEPADFPGGREALLKYLSDNIVYPDRALKNKLQGKCYIQFVITDEGKVEQIIVKKGVVDCPECDAESVKAIEKMPLWTPGKINGKNVNSRFSLPVTFKL